MKKILIFGNSGSGKSTLAKKLCSAHKLAHLDLDTLAWEPSNPPMRTPIEESKLRIADFIGTNDGWVIEGCYTDLLKLAEPFSNEIIYMNLPVILCVENAKKRPWEPHKYESKDAQDKNLNMLIRWISEYSEREDTFSERAHSELYEEYPGEKRMVTVNE